MTGPDSTRDTSAYVLGGERIVSVTEAIQLSGLSSFDRVAPDVLEAARVRGQVVHALTADIDRGEPPLLCPDDEAVRACVYAYQRFKSDTGFKPELIEFPVIHPTQKYAGTLDRYGLLRGQPAVLDLKCSRTVSPWVGLQLAGYAMALQAEVGLRESASIKRYALRLSPGGYSLVPFTDPNDFLTFLACVRLARWRIHHERIEL